MGGWAGGQAPTVTGNVLSVTLTSFVLADSLN